MKRITKLISIMLIIILLLGITVPIASASNDPIVQFVERLYTLVLNRGSDPAGLLHWSGLLRNKQLSGAEVAAGFFFSAEMLGRNLSNSRYVEVLYLTLLNRRPDAPGQAAWENLIGSGGSREQVFHGFVMSPEFDGICSQYGIVRGTYTPPVGTPQPPAQPQPSNPFEAFAAEVVRLTNLERTSRGLTALTTTNVVLNQAAAVRANETTAYFSHTRPDGRDWYTAYTDLGGARYRELGENLAYGQPTPAWAINDWMNSPPHRSTLLHPTFTHIGIGIAQDSAGRYYWTQLFFR